ncbi:MAG: tRNA uridine-5-carboxymethylaminomethyl(34) synthesis GTPase MnmE [Acidobacteria bacterium RIFCSPLOWO2_12_FULL_67_14b]|nr:MAG: tRNA uridine-5-carboxymethylaminomethyl(34) synthesis GTPase MnmE [Acidobacteria bacterium RIFCSPLOWO2_12_FULL_67_14b]
MVFSTSDTIVAIATPSGRGGIGVVRLSGPDAARIAGALVGRDKPFEPRHATFAKLVVESGFSTAEASAKAVSRTNSLHRIGDELVVTAFPAPQSYTGEDVVEISAHGSPVVLSAILTRAIEAGARLAEPGEFTLRAFLNGKLDLIQAEAVADLIDAVTPLQARAAFDQLEGTLTVAIGAIEGALFDVMARLEASLDFPDEGYHFVEPAAAVAAIAQVMAGIDTLLAHAARGRLVREGAQVAIVGAPNVGRTSLFNALLNANRAIVTPIPGTTRDLLTERADIGGLSLGLIDTAGVREAADPIEQEGVSRARGTLAVADLVLVVLDRSRALSDDDRALLELTASLPRLIVVNKIDLPGLLDLTTSGSLPTSSASVKTGEGLDALIAEIARALNAGDCRRDTPAITNIRHTQLLERARASLARANTALEGAVSEEFPLVDLQDASHALQEISGRRTTDDLLRHIFEKFCIGK